MSRGLCLAVALTVGAAACGSTPPPPSQADAGQQMMLNASYWGLADQTCWRYDDGSGNNYYTIAVDEDHTTIAGVTTYHLTFRLQGLQQREDWLQVSGTSLLAWRHTDPPDLAMRLPARYSLYSPAPVFFQANIPVNMSVKSSTTAMVSDGTNTTTVPLTFTVIDEVHEDVNALMAAKQATKFLLTVSQSNGSATVDKFWFVPNLGIAQFQLSGGTQWNLTKVDSNVTSTNCVPM